MRAVLDLCSIDGKESLVLRQGCVILAYVVSWSHDPDVQTNDWIGGIHIDPVTKKPGTFFGRKRPFSWLVEQLSFC